MCHRYLFPLTYFCSKHLPSCSTCIIFSQRIIIKISEKAESHNFIKPLIIFVFNVYNFPYKIQEWQELHWTNWRIEWNNIETPAKLTVWRSEEVVGSAESIYKLENNSTYSLMTRNSLYSTSFIYIYYMQLEIIYHSYVLVICYNSFICSLFCN